MDSATASLKRPFIARILVEVDMAKEPVQRIWIGGEDFGH